MMEQRRLFLTILIFFWSLSGCASIDRRCRKEIADLKDRLQVVSDKLESAEKEKSDLEKELTLFRKTQDIDTQKFIDALGVFERGLKNETAQQEVWLAITDRGLVITVSAEKLFASGTDTLSDGGKAFLDKAYAVMETEFPSSYIYVEGHTDNQSLAVFEWKSDWDFSFARALSVVQYFTTKKGMDPLRFSASGFGQYRPKAGNDTKEGRRLNRRVEVIVSPQKLRYVMH